MLLRGERPEQESFNHMPLDNPEQNDPPANLDWATAPDQFRSAHERNQQTLESERTAAADLRRENAALRAGIDTETPLGQMFVSSYQGEMTPDAMRTAFEALGVSTTPPAPTSETPPPTTAPTEQELEEQRLRGVVHGQSTPPGEEPAGDLWLGSGGVFPTFHENLSRGMRRDDAGAAALDVLFQAAMDPAHPQHDQAVWNRDRWLQSQGR